jgi:hypothetical protein
MLGLLQRCGDAHPGEYRHRLLPHAVGSIFRFNGRGGILVEDGPAASLGGG